MKRILLIVMTLMVGFTCARAQDAIDDMEVPSALQKVFAGYYHFIEPESGDTLMMLVFNPIRVYPRERFRNKQAYMVEFEKQLFKQYKPQMKKMTKSQGKMLIKLINRETNQDSYHIIKAFLGTFRAGFWQTFGKFFGVSLKQGYHPNKNKDDAMIERICVRIEQGTL